jgi:hypothetical protein
VTLAFDGDSTVEYHTCDKCGADYLLVKCFLIDAEGPCAITLAALHHHDDYEAWIDVIFGVFDEQAAQDDRLTFGCRVGPVAGSADPAATAVEAAVPYADGPVFGHKLSRDEALAHPRLAEFWSVVDFLLENEQNINHHVYHRGPR